MDRNDSSDAEDILNAYLHPYDGPQIQLWACYSAKRAGTGQDSTKQRSEETHWVDVRGENGRCMVRDQC